MKLSTVTKGILAASAVGVAAASTLATTPAQASNHTYHGCPYGYVCIYQSRADVNSGHYTYGFVSYGGHNIYNQYGTKYFVDNQFGATGLGLCAKANGAGGDANVSVPFVDNGSYLPDVYSTNFTPVNSLDLEPGSRALNTCQL